MNAKRARCRFTVAIPAKNECTTIARTLRALVEQRDLSGDRLDPERFETIVLANNCSDGTAEIAHAFAAAHPAYAIHIVSRALPPGLAHVGTARRMALDLAFERQRAFEGDTGIIATTDADSMVAPTWVAQTITEMKNADAVAGSVEIAEAERDAMEAPVRLSYDRERAYRRTRGEIEARFDPRPHDPASRHDSFVGASFAVRAATYAAAGRLPMLPRLEDLAFAKALRRIDARIRHSYDVRVETSARFQPRVDGGFGTFLRTLRTHDARRESLWVENATRTILRAKARMALRACWLQPMDAHLLALAADAYGIATHALFASIDAWAPFGESLDRIEREKIVFEELPDEPVEIALGGLRAVLSAPAAVQRVRSFDEPGMRERLRIIPQRDFLRSREFFGEQAELARGLD